MIKIYCICIALSTGKHLHRLRSPGSFCSKSIYFLPFNVAVMVGVLSLLTVHLHVFTTSYSIPNSVLQPQNQHEFLHSHSNLPIFQACEVFLLKLNQSIVITTFLTPFCLHRHLLSGRHSLEVVCAVFSLSNEPDRPRQHMVIRVTMITPRCFQAASFSYSVEIHRSDKV